MADRRSVDKSTEPGETNPVKIVFHAADFLLKLAIVAVFVFVLVYGGRRLYQFGYSIFTTEAAAEAPGEDIEVTVLTGMSKRSVGTLLKNKGVIRDENVFYVQALIYGYELQPGTYILNNSETVEKILITLSSGVKEE